MQTFVDFTTGKVIIISGVQFGTPFVIPEGQMTALGNAIGPTPCPGLGDAMEGPCCDGIRSAPWRHCVWAFLLVEAAG